MMDILSKSITREEALSKLWRERENFEREDKLEEFEKIEKEIKSVPVLNLTVAVEFSNEQISQIQERIINMFKKNVFLELRVDPKIVGGCIFVWNGEVYDYSLKRTILEKRNEFKKIVNSFIN